MVTDLGTVDGLVVVCVCVCVIAGENGFSDESTHRIIISSRAIIWRWIIVSIVICSLLQQTGAVRDLCIKCQVHDR